VRQVAASKSRKVKGAVWYQIAFLAQFALLFIKRELFLPFDLLAPVFLATLVWI